MARDFNENRSVNAVLGNKSLNKYGANFAVEYGLDGFSMVNISAEPVPTDIKIYLEGADYTSFAVPSNVTKLCDYALASFPDLTNIYLFKNDSIVTLDDDLSYLSNLAKIYVPTDLLATYNSTYTDSSSTSYKAYLVGKFDTIVEDYTLEIKKLDTDSDTLTSAIIQRYIDSASSQQKNAYTKVVVSGFTDYLSALWLYNFSEVLPQLNNNIWYGSTQLDFTTYTITGSGELTDLIVNEQYANGISSDKKSLVTKVIVPIDFTSYASGSIQEIQDDFTNMRYLETTYSGGAMTLDLTGEHADVIAKITSIGKTLDEALVYARTYNGSNLSMDTNIIIVPPYNNVNGYNFGRLATNLVYIDSVSLAFDYRFLLGTTNVVKIKKVTLNNSFSGIAIFSGSYDSLPIKEMTYDFSALQESQQGDISIYGSNSVLEKLIMTNFMCDLTFIVTNSYNSFTRQSLVDLINSLGTPSTTRTLTIGSTNLAKLTNADIQLAYDKNWQLSPTPSAFTFTIGANTYSCDFGMTWAEWVASAYNTDNYHILGIKVYNSDYTKTIQLDNIDVNSSSLVRYGDTYNISATSVNNILLIEAQSGETALTSTIVARELAKVSGSENLIDSIVIDSAFTSGYMELVFGGVDTTTFTNLRYLAQDNETVDIQGTGNFSTDSFFKIWVLSRYATTIPYSVGDTKSVVWDSDIYTLRITDKTNNRYACSDNNSFGNKLVIEFVECYKTGYAVASNNSNNGGWAICSMKTTTLPNLLQLMDSNLTKFITKVQVESASDGSASGSGSLSYSSNDLFLPSNYEITGGNQYSNSIEATTRYEYYVGKTGTALAKTVVNGTDYVTYATRSPVPNRNSSFARITTSGTTSYYDNASQAISFAPFFCI